MCVIVHQPKGTQIDKETCRKLWQANPDGGGFAFIDDSRELVVTKSMEFKTYWSLFEQARSANLDRDFLLHMRVATHGSVKIENVHPFVVDEHTLMAHNGIMHGVPDYKDDRTDTEVFITDVLPELPEGWQDSQYLTSMVEDWMGWSKLMFITTSLTLDKDIYRLGEWREHKGLYLTNMTGLEPKKTTLVKTYPASQTSYYESSFGWNEWWDHDNGRSETAWEEELFEGQLKAERKTMMINHDILAVEDGYECYGCNKIIDTKTAECECWNAVCTECYQFVARCSVEGKCLTSVHIDYENLDNEGQNEVSKRVGSVQEVETNEDGKVINLFS